MLIIPAIDIKDGRVVRLHQGRFDRVTDYGDDPVAAARRWEELGAPCLHVVDLDGALSGEGSNREAVISIAKALRIPVQTGGGIRTRASVDALLEAGLARVVVGTRAVDDRPFLAEIIKAWGERIAVSIDCANGFVARRGWVETSQTRGVDLARDLAAIGLRHIIYTDIARDGTLEGPNLNGLREILDAVDIHVTASGGIKDLIDVQALLALRSRNLYGAITGRAIYEGTLDLRAAVEACRAAGEDPC